MSRENDNTITSFVSFSVKGASPLHSGQTPRLRNMSRFNGGKLQGNSKHFFEKLKDKGVPGKKSFKL